MRAKSLSLVVGGVLVALGCAALAHAVTLVVNSTADVVDAHPGDGRCDTGRPSPSAPATPECTLRAAIQEANALGGSNVVTLPAGTYTLTIAATAFEDANLNGDLDITSDLGIVGAGAPTTIVQACAPAPPAATCIGLNRVLDVDPEATGISVSISGLTIRYGYMSAFADTSGGGIRNRGRLTITDSVITANTVTNPSGVSYGGGISNEAGDLTLINTSVVGNTSGYVGGGIVNRGLATLTLVNSSVADNISGYLGGGIYSEGRLSISDTSIARNTALTGGGGGIFRARGTLTLSNSTISGNTATVGVTGGGGGGLGSSNANDGPNVLTNCTISGNIGIHGGGIASGAPLEVRSCTVVANQVFSVPSSQTSTGGGISGSAILANTVVAGNSSDSGQSPDCEGTMTSLGYNLIQSTVGCLLEGTLDGNITGQDPGLGVLADNGGPTRTHALLAGSP